MYINEEIVGDQVVAEATQAEDVTVEIPTTQTIKFSSGVEFTPEELESLDPEVKAKLLKVKDGDVNYAKGYNKLVQEVKALKEHDKKPEVKTDEAVVKETLAPKADVLSEDDAAIKAYNLSRMTNEKFAIAVEEAKGKYGEKVVDIIGQKLSVQLKALVDAGKYNTDFSAIFDQAFSTLVTSDQATFDAFNAYKAGKTEEEIALAKEQEEKAKVLLQKETPPGTMPAGGSGVLNKPVVEGKPSTIKEANLKFKEAIREIYKK